MKSIRSKLERNKLILRITDESNILYICRSINFEKKSNLSGKDKYLSTADIESIRRNFI